jgi:hypothetical protein
MVELGLLFAGVLALPWYVLGILVIVFLCDVGASSRESFSFATVVMLVGLVVVSGLGWWTDGFNPLSWAWNNPVDVITGFVAYSLVGCVWCILKWKLFLRKAFKRAEVSHAEELRRFHSNGGHTMGGRPTLAEPKKTRPSDSYYAHNAGRLTGWIFHWPFSMLGVIVGDVIIRFAESLYKALGGLFERMAKSQFKGYEEN